MRVHRTVLVLTTGVLVALGSPCLAADLKGRVKSIDPVKQRLIVTTKGDKGVEQDVRVKVADDAAIETPRGKPLDLSNVEVGSPVVIREGVEATRIVVKHSLKGVVKSVDDEANKIAIAEDKTSRETQFTLDPGATILSPKGDAIELENLEPGSQVTVTYDEGTASEIVVDRAAERPFLAEFWYNFRHNLFKPLLLFFYMGFLIPILRVKFDFPYVIYQGLTIYLLIAIGWHGGEELAGLESSVLGRVVVFMAVGFIVNFVIGCVAYALLRGFTPMRRIDAATVAGYYGSDSAGTFVTCLGVLATAKIAYDAFMPVMLAVMEIPGCLVALYLVSTLRKRRMDALGNMPDESGYDVSAKPAEGAPGHENGGNHGGEGAGENGVGNHGHQEVHHPGIFSPELLHEVFLNPGIYLLFGGILVGFISRSQGPLVTKPDDPLFVDLFQGLLCLFLLEMGMTASRRLRDLKTAGWQFVLFGVMAPPLFATFGIIVAHAYSWLSGQPFQLGTYVLFSVLCGAASYIAVPAVQRLAIPEASPTLPLAASLGLTFSFNVTIGIPIYIGIAKYVMKTFPIG